jgi:hypothetical protein
MVTSAFKVTSLFRHHPQSHRPQGVTDKKASILRVLVLK